MAKETNDYSGEVDSASPESILEVDKNDPTLVLTQDLQRLHADFSNYRRRVDKERLEAEDLATAKVLRQLLLTLDDIERARAHGELEGGFKAVANHLVSATSALGLERFDDINVPFDPNIHEAIAHQLSEDVDETKVTQVLRSGYLYKDKVIRPAQVVVSDPLAPVSQK